MAPPFIQANSLSDITQLAANPPKYPRNPTEAKRQPLTLYIARVPGSRDVILTTLKPQLKNVTVADVASSLYYFHLNTEDDARILAEEEEAMSAEKASSLSSMSASMQKPLPRKPLPDGARPSIEVRPSLDIRPQEFAVPRRPVLPSAVSESTNMVSLQKPSQVETAAARRPLGPRLPVSESSIGRKPLPGIENRPLPPVQDDAYHPKASSETARSGKSPYDHLLATPFPDSTKSFSITVIRRDPASGAQWNIGTVLGRPRVDENQDRGSKSTSRPKKTYFDMSIHLSTPGYTTFRDRQPREHPGNGVSKAQQSLRNDLAGVTPNVDDAPKTINAAGFERQLYMEGSGFWSRSAMQHKRTPSDLSEKHTTARGRSYSGGSTIGTSGMGTSAPSEREDIGDSQTKGYVFVSPWGGRCKFTTGSGGRSLRCKHALPGPMPSAESMAAPQASAAVSELRFNLPSSTLFTTPTSKTTSKERMKERFSLSNFGHHRKKSSLENRVPPLPSRPNGLDPSSYAAMYPSDGEDGPPLPPRSNLSSRAPESSGEDSSSLPRDSFQSTRSSERLDRDEDRLDLSLGQEMAGGGNRGKRVKLGKLIIHDEGFKMLDLVVSANMAIWWSVWESDR
ncbi:hypothetical protein B0J14DRAFT_133948 [Halenospora varia]|nr:hypothetical protein B0J14DRAFT_133948 [Halenospora varia]